MTDNIEIKKQKKDVSREDINDLIQKLEKLEKAKNFEEKRRNSYEKKNVIIDFFAKYGIEIGHNGACNRIGNACSLEEFKDHKKEDVASYVWTSVTKVQLQRDFWWLCYGKDYGIYVFNLPGKKLTREDFKETLLTKGRNRTKKEDEKQSDIIIDVKDEDYIEILSDYHKLSDYFVAKLDFKSERKNLTFNETRMVSEKEYEERRTELINGLNEEQKRAVEAECKGALVTAGAGCGKTRTLMGRICHLYKEGKIKTSDDLLLVAFNRKNREDFKEKLRYYGLSKFESSAHTFHSLGYSIIKTVNSTFNSYGEEDDPLGDLLKLFENENYRPKDNNKSGRKIIIEKCEQYSGEVRRIKDDNWIKKLYSWSETNLGEDENEDARESERLYGVFVPDIDLQQYIYSLENKSFEDGHFGVCLNGRDYRHGDDDICKLRMLNYLILNGYTEDDINVNRKEKYVQIPLLGSEKFYWDNYGLNTDFSRLKEAIKPKKRLTREEIFKKNNIAIIRARMTKFEKVARQFISLCKIYNIIHKETKNEDFRKLKESIKKALPYLKRPKFRAPDGYIRPHSLEFLEKKIDAFFDLIVPVYDLYEKFLTGDEDTIMDFNDMINESVSMINDNVLPDDTYKYKYMFVDEFQDIAFDTFKLIKLLKDRSNASIMCVGDDWQAIYSWRGSDLRFFNGFEKYFEIEKKDYESFKVTTTYRYGQKLADVSDKFINKAENKKDIKSDKSTPDTRIIEWSWGWNELLDKIKSEYGKEGDISVKVLSRRNSSSESILGRSLSKLTEDLRKKFGKEDDNENTTDAMTIHRAKGLEADVVILIDIDPSEMIADVVLQYFAYKYNQTVDTSQEERRLFYVAMTRAKKACYFYNPCSSFWDEIVKDDEDFGNIELDNIHQNLTGEE